MDGVFLIMGRWGYRPFLYPGHIGLGNRPHMHIRVECGIFLDRPEQVNKPKVRYDFKSANSNFLVHLRQSFHF